MRVVALLALFNLVLSSSMIVGIPVIVVNVLSLSDLHLGVAQAALGLGGLLGGLLGGVFSKKLKLRYTPVVLIVCAICAALMGVAICPFMPPIVGFAVICASAVAVMAAATLFTVQLCAAIQRQTPAHLIGKIMALILMITNCALPVGQAIYGVLFDALAACPYWILFGAAALALAIAALSGKTFARLEREDAGLVAAAEILQGE